MKNYLKGLINGVLIAAVIFSVPVLAENIQVAFNEFRINVNGVDTAQWGESYTLDNGNTVPYSITYNDTTYLPLRKIGELMGNTVSYNGDTDTVSVTDERKDINVVAEQPDINGNVWTYFTFNTYNGSYYQYFLGVKDEQRGFERIYKIYGGYVTVTDEAIYFLKNTGKVYKHYSSNYTYIYDLQKILFLNDANSQDGEAISSYRLDEAIFDGEYIYYKYYTGPSNAPRDELYAANIITGKTVDVSYSLPVGHSFKLTLIDDGVIECTDYTYKDNVWRITFDKTENKFVGAVKAESEQ